MEDYLVYVDDGQLTNIFEKLGSPEDLASAYKVCRRWRDAGNAGILFRRILIVLGTSKLFLQGWKEGYGNSSV